MKKLKIQCLILAAMLCLSSCGSDTSEDTGETVENIFTTPTSVTQNTDRDPAVTENNQTEVNRTDPGETETQNTEPKETTVTWTGEITGSVTKDEFIENRRACRSISFGFGGEDEDEDGWPYCTYNGGEMCMPVMITAEGCSEIGVGVLITIDGVPQPYRTDEDDTYKYVHTFYPPENDSEYTYYNCYLVPVTGNAGDVLEANVMCVIWPDYFLDQGPLTNQYTGGTTGHHFRLVMNADPAEQPETGVESRVISCTTEYVDLSSAVLSDWTDGDFMTRIESELYVNNSSTSNTRYNYFGSNLTIRYEIWGAAAGQYGLAVYVDNEPIAVDEDEWMFVEIRSGQKTVIEVEVDMSDYDGSSVVYAALVARNYCFPGGKIQGAAVIFDNSRTFYLSYAPSIDALMGWE